MKKKLFSGVAVLAGLAFLVVMITVFTETKAQEGRDAEEELPSAEYCPPDKCYGTPTLESEAYGEPLAPDGTCVCSNTLVDSDCNYEYVPAFACMSEDNRDRNDWFTDYWGSDWGLQKYHSSSPYVKFFCPVPSADLYDPDKNYQDVKYVVGYFYNYDTSTTNKAWLQFGTCTETGTCTYTTTSQGGAGQYSILLAAPTTTYHFWWVMGQPQNNYNSSFHGFRVCYDPT